MSILVDIIIVATVLISTFLAYRKGMLKLAIQMVAVIISILITLILYKPVSSLIINATTIDEMIEDTILEKANDIITDDGEYANELIDSVEQNVLPETAETIAVNIIQWVVIIILYIIARMLLKFVSSIANWIASLPILKQVNKTGGIIYGILRGLLIVYVILFIVNMIGDVNEKNTVYTATDESYIGSTMMEHNVLNIFFD